MPGPSPCADDCHDAQRNGDDAILVTDAQGTVRFVSRPCAALLGCDSRLALGLPCWKVMRLQASDGTRFCAPDCAIQRQVRDGSRPLPWRLVYPSPDGLPLVLDVRSICLPAPPSVRHAVVHILSPASLLSVRVRASACSVAVDCGPAAEPRASVNRAAGLLLLSPRERDVLDLIAAGHTTGAVACRLSISPMTVRNHIQRILCKTGSHRRLDAVLLWLQRRR